jgi:hypothetical protein
MLTWFIRVVFRGESKSAILPFCLASPFFLGSAAIDASSVDFGVALRLEIVETVGKVREGGDSGSRIFVWAGYSS